MDVHDGNIFFKDGYYHMYGVGYGDCVETSSWFPPRQCPGIWSPAGRCGFRLDHRIRLYKSLNLKSWELFGDDILPRLSRPEGIYFRPKVISRDNLFYLFVNFLPISSGSSQHFWESLPIHAYTHSVILRAVSNLSSGPFMIEPRSLILEKSGPGDFDIFEDRISNRVFIAYSSWSTNHRIRIEMLRSSLDGTEKSVKGISVSPPMMEAPILFQRKGQYFLFFGKICCFCAEGAGSQVYTSSNILSGWENAGVNLFPKRSLFCGGRDVQAQNNAVFSIRGMEKEFIYTADMWHSSRDGKKSHDAQFWAKLMFRKEDGIPFILNESSYTNGSGFRYTDKDGISRRVMSEASSPLRCQNSNVPHPVLMLLFVFFVFFLFICLFSWYLIKLTDPLLRIGGVML